VIITDATQAQTTVRFGAYGELFEVVDPEGHSAKAIYGEEGEVQRITAPDGARMTFAYDADGNVTGITDPLQQTANFGYTTDFARLTWLRDGNNHTRHLSYDNRGNLKGMAYPDGRSEGFAYDAAGRVTDVTDRTGRTATVLYDQTKRPSRVTYASGRTVDYQYDAHNNVLAVTDSVTGAVTMQYDAKDRLTHIAYPGGHWFTYEYDNADRRTRRLGDDGFDLRYTYTAQGSLASLTDAQGKTYSRYEYDALGRVNKETKGNGTSASYTYTKSGYVASITHAKADGTVLAFANYVYDTCSRPLTITSQDGVTSYTYDATGQLTGVTTPQGRKVQYAYDAAGNRKTVSDNGATATYTTNDMDQYSQVGPLACTYDTNGNLILKSDGSHTWKYTYDERNRLVKTETPAGVWEYEYDPLGSRSAVTHDGVRTRYVVDPVGLGDVAEEINDTSGQVTHYLHGLGLAGAIGSDGTSSYYGFDGIGNAVLLTGADGNAQNRYRYLPFGECEVVQAGAPNPFLFNGEAGVMDDGSGLNYMRARYYDPAMGRFMTPDPINIAGGMNLYTFASNTPLAVYDPTGLSGKWAARFRAVHNIYSIGKDAVSAIQGGLTIAAGAGLTLTGAGATIGPLIMAYGMITTGDSILRFQEKTLHWGLNEPDNYLHDAATTLGKASANGRMSYNYRTLNTMKNLRKGGIDYLRDKLIDILLYIGEQLAENLSNEAGKNSGGGTGRGQNVITSWDPNEKAGPAGYGATHAVPAGQPLPYIIYFENVKTATAPAATVTVTDVLDANLDWSTFMLGEVAFRKVP